MTELLERECSDLHCEYPYGPCCGAVERNLLRQEAHRDVLGRAILKGLRKDVGDEIVDEIVNCFEGNNPLFNTMQAVRAVLNAKETQP